MKMVGASRKGRGAAAMMARGVAARRGGVRSAGVGGHDVGYHWSG